MTKKSTFFWPFRVFAEGAPFSQTAATLVCATTHAADFMNHCCPSRILIYLPYLLPPSDIHYARPSIVVYRFHQ